MEIVSKGKLATDIKYTMSCNHCGSVTIFDHSEGREVPDQRDGDAIVFDCPTCHREMWHGVKARRPSSW